MSAVKLWKKFMIRALLSLVFFVNALAPAGASAKSFMGGGKTTNSATSTNDEFANRMALGGADIQSDEQVPILSEQIARQAQQARQNRQMQPVRFRVEADPDVFIPGRSGPGEW